ncbi:MAG: hypothetical protein U0794_03990 [Isosphaeraceae bacterium]
MARRSTLPDNLVYRAAEYFCGDPNLSAGDIARLLNEQYTFEPRLTRETAYELISEARARRHLQLRPPRAEALEHALAQTFRLSIEKIHVVNVHTPDSNAFVAAAAAELVFGLLTHYARMGMAELGLGLGPGRATRDFSRHLGILLSRSEHAIKLRLTAIAAGCPALEPQSAPASHFAFYPPSAVTQRIGFFAKSVMSQEEFNSPRFREKTGILEPHAEKNNIQIVVTSMGDFNDAHDLMAQFLIKSGFRPSEHLPGCLGSVQYRPYTADGPFREPEPVPRAATLFELDEFVELARQDERHVILISRMCGLCSKVHSNALLPLLENPKLRVWSDIVLDVPTAQGVLALRNKALRGSEFTQIGKDGRAFRAVELFSSTREQTATEIATTLSTEFKSGSRVSREMVYNLMQTARKEKYVQLVPRLESALALEVAATFGLDPETIRVVDTPTKDLNTMVADRAAQWVLELAENLIARLQPMWQSSQVDKRLQGVGLGIGPGRASLDFCRSLGEQLRERGDGLKLRLISLAAGSPALSPEFSSANFFNLFPEDQIVDHVGYFAETVMTPREFSAEEFRRTTGVREPFEEKNRDRIHIVVNSMGNLEDDHDLLRNLLEASQVDRTRDLKGCIGSVQYRPFTATGPFKETARVPRATTLYELEEFAELAVRKNRHVVLIVRRCGLCGRTHADALRALLTVRSLKVWSELILDAATARELLGKGRFPTTKGRPAS